MSQIIFEFIKKGKRLEDIDDYVIYTGVGRLLKQDPDTIVVGVTDPKDLGGYPTKPQTKVFFDSHGQPGEINIGSLEDMENSRALLAVRPSEIDSSLPTPPFRWIGDYVQTLNFDNVSSVTALACSGAIKGDFPNGSTSICNGLAKGVKELSLGKNCPVIGYYGRPLLHPDPNQPITTVNYSIDNEYSKLQKDLENGLLPNREAFLVDDKPFNIIKEVSNYLNGPGANKNFQERALDIAQITEPFYTKLAALVKALGYEQSFAEVEQHTLSIYSQKPVIRPWGNQHVTSYISKKEWNQLIPYGNPTLDPYDTTNDTPLHTAIRNIDNPYDLQSQLESLTENYNEVNTQGFTPLELAQALGKDNQLIEMIESFVNKAHKNTM